MQYKALILDVDGTIIPYEKDSLPSEKVTAAIKKASEKIHVCLATGRPLFMLTHIFEHLNMKGLAIINDGAQVIDIQSGQIYYEQPMDSKDVVLVCNILAEANVTFYIQDSGKDLLYTKRYVPKKAFNVFSLQEMDEHDVDVLIESLSHIPGIKVNKTHAAESYHLLISHASATKLHGIYEVARILKLKKKEIIGVGDSGNDFSLLMASGFKVAMGNAIEDLKAVADYIAPSVTEDGVADVIEKFILDEKNEI